MRYGVTLPNFGLGGDPSLLADLAAEAEGAGWEGVFIWDAIPWRSFSPVKQAEGCDAWIALAAAATRTEKVLLGTMITPLAWRKPAQTAFQCLSLDHLSRGRAVLPVGLGAVEEGRPVPYGEEGDRRVRAERMDEALAIINGLWSGRTFSFKGEHFRADKIRMLPKPVQRPRVPVWVVGAWPRMKSMRRTLMWDGVLPNFIPEAGGGHKQMKPGDLAAMADWLRSNRDQPIDVIWEASSPASPSKARAKVKPYADAGATWWLEAVWESIYREPGDVEPIRKRIAAGPPVVG